MEPHDAPLETDPPQDARPDAQPRTPSEAPSGETPEARPGSLGEPAPDAPRRAPSGEDGAEPGPAPDSDPSFEDVVLAAVRRKPHTGYALARHVERFWPGYLKEREGYLYAVLLELWRKGALDVAWADLPQGRRRVYSAPPLPGATGAASLDDAEGARAPEQVVGATGGVGAHARTTTGAWRPRLEKTAAACTRRLRFAPRLEEEYRAEIAGHLADAAAAYSDIGRPHDAAEQRAIRDLGDTWRIRTDLRRAALGRRTVVFPRTVLEGLQGIAIYDLRILVVIIGLILFVRVQVVTAYHIPTRSMEPTLHGDKDDGDRILVNKWCGAVDRFDIVVFDGWGGDRKNYVKRAIGLPGEQLDIYGGNLWIDGQLLRKRGTAYESMLFPLYRLDSEADLARRTTPEDALGDLKTQLNERWRGDAGEWRLDVPDAVDPTFTATAGDTPATLVFDDGGSIRDGVWDPIDASSDGGSELVSDLRVDIRVQPGDGHTRTGIRLMRGDQVYEAFLSDDGAGLEVLVDGAVIHTDDTLHLRHDGPTELRFAQVDLVLRVDVDGRQVFEHDLPAPEFPKTGSPRGELRVLVTDGTAGITPLVVERDIHWTSGDYDDRTSVKLGGDEYFMLGDNSSNSRDSRSNGPVHASRLVGKPMLVVWPPRRFLHVPR